MKQNQREEHKAGYHTIQIISWYLVLAQISL